MCTSSLRGPFHSRASKFIHLMWPLERNALYRHLVLPCMYPDSCCQPSPPPGLVPCSPNISPLNQNLSLYQFHCTGDVVLVDPGASLPTRLIGRSTRCIKRLGRWANCQDAEHALACHPAVLCAAVQPVPISNKHASYTGSPPPLAAFVVTAQGEEFTLEPFASTLRRHCRTILPPHTVPTFFVPVPSLPMTKNQKVDMDSLCLLLSPEHLPGGCLNSLEPKQAVLALIQAMCDHWDGSLDVSLPALGLDSISMVDFLARVAVAFNLKKTDHKYQAVAHLAWHSPVCQLIQGLTNLADLCNVEETGQGNTSKETPPDQSLGTSFKMQSPMFSVHNPQPGHSATGGLSDWHLFQPHLVIVGGLDTYHVHPACEKNGKICQLYSRSQEHLRCFPSPDAAAQSALTPRWKADLQQCVDAPASAVVGTLPQHHPGPGADYAVESLVLCGSHSHILACFVASTGHTLWSRALDDRVESAPSLCPDTWRVCVATHCGTVWLFTLVDGQALSAVSVTGVPGPPIRSSPCFAISCAALCIGAYSRCSGIGETIFLLDPASFLRLKAYSVGGSVCAPLLRLLNCCVGLSSCNVCVSCQSVGRPSGAMVPEGVVWAQEQFEIIVCCTTSGTVTAILLRLPADSGCRILWSHVFSGVRAPVFSRPCPLHSNSNHAAQIAVIRADGELNILCVFTGVCHAAISLSAVLSRSPICVYSPLFVVGKNHSRLVFADHLGCLNMLCLSELQPVKLTAESSHPKAYICSHKICDGPPPPVLGQMLLLSRDMGHARNRFLVSTSQGKLVLFDVESDDAWSSKGQVLDGNACSCTDNDPFFCKHSSRVLFELGRADTVAAVSKIDAHGVLYEQGTLPAFFAPPLCVLDWVVVGARDNCLHCFQWGRQQNHAKLYRT